MICAALPARERSCCRTAGAPDGASPGSALLVTAIRNLRTAEGALSGSPTRRSSLLHKARYSRFRFNGPVNCSAAETPRVECQTHDIVFVDGSLRSVRRQRYASLTDVTCFRSG